MKAKKLLSVGIILLLMPASSQAQQNIQKAFDAFIKNKNIKISTSLSMDKDPETGRKRSQKDIYEYSLPKAKMAWVENVCHAFNTDRDNAYTFATGQTPDRKYFSAPFTLAVGDSNVGGVVIGREKNTQYIYACFADPADKEKKYRYAYAIEWRTEGNEVKGRLIMTYATKANKRSNLREIYVNGTSLNNLRSLDSLKAFQSVSAAASALSSLGIDNIALEGKGDETVLWLSRFTTYQKLLDQHKSSDVASIWATRLYGLCKKVPPLSSEERDTCIKSLEKLRSHFSDEIISDILEKSIAQLKK